MKGLPQTLQYSFIFVDGFIAHPIIRLGSSPGRIRTYKRLRAAWLTARSTAVVGPVNSIASETQTTEGLVDSFPGIFRSPF